MSATEEIQTAIAAVKAAEGTGDNETIRAAEDALAAFLQGDLVRTENAVAVASATNALNAAPHDKAKRDDFIKAWKADRAVDAPPAGPLPGAKWEAGEPEPREWLVKGWLPAGRLASLYGAGGAGKSRLALQVAAAVMHGGEPVKTRDLPDGELADAAGLCAMREGGQRVLWLTWEDEITEFRRRWRMAARAGAVKAEDPDPAKLTLVDMRQIGGPLWAPSPGGHVSNRATWTPAGERFLKTLEGHALAIIDPIAAAFMSSEIDRSLVRAFAAALDGAAEASGCAVLLIGHPPKEAEKGTSGSGYSGSTDWRNAVRSMLVLETSDQTGHCIAGEGREKAKAAQAAKAWRLRLDKASYAQDGTSVWLARHYDEGEGEGPRLAWFASTASEAARVYNPGRNVTRNDDDKSQAAKANGAGSDTGSGKSRPKTEAERIAARDAGKGIL